MARTGDAGQQTGSIELLQREQVRDVRKQFTDNAHRREQRSILTVDYALPGTGDTFVRIFLRFSVELTYIFRVTESQHIVFYMWSNSCMEIVQLQIVSVKYR